LVSREAAAVAVPPALGPLVPAPPATRLTTEPTTDESDRPSLAPPAGNDDFELPPAEVPDDGPAEFGEGTETVRDGTDAAGVVTDGTVPTGVVTFGVVAEGVVTFGVVAVGVVTFGVVTDGVAIFGVDTDGTVTFGTVAAGTVAAGTAAVGTATLGALTAGTATEGNDWSADATAASTSAKPMIVAARKVRRRRCPARRDRETRIGSPLFCFVSGSYPMLTKANTDHLIGWVNASGAVAP
jgi:hypothetical protein